MATLNKASYEAKYNDAGTGIFKAGQTRGIGSEDARSLVEDEADSLLFREDDFVDEDDMSSDSATKVPSQQSVKAYVDAAGITREFGRTFSSELLFDNDETEYEIYTQTTPITFTIAPAGNLEDRNPIITSRIVSDGVNPWNFDGFSHISGIANGQVLDAGTYQIIFWYSNGVARASLMLPSQEVANLTPLATPENFAVAQDGETAIDANWDDNADSSGARLSVSPNGVTAWTVLATLEPGTTTYKHEGLTAGDHWFYRLQFIGNLTTNTNSNYAYADTVIAAAGDTDAPVPSFLPANGNSTWTVNKAIVITFDEAIRNTNASEVTNANVAALITLKETNSGGTNIAFTATINAGKTVITINPTTHYGANQLVYVAVNNFEDVNGNEETTPQAITFTTTEFTDFNGVSAFVLNDDILDSIITANNGNFWAEVTISNFATTGIRRLICKTANAGDGGKTFSSYYNEDDVYFAYYMNGGGYRFIKWTGVLTPGERILVFKYDGSIDTNDGLDRVTLDIDGVLQGSKTISVTSGSLNDGLFNSTTKLAFGIQVGAGGVPSETYYFSGEAKDWIMRSNSGATVQMNIPNLKTGTDTSGNGFNGVFQ